MRIESKGARDTSSAPVLDRRDQMLAVAFGGWMLIGLFIDGWAHDNNRPETFFTPWHGILYSGFAASAANAAWAVRRHRTPGRRWRDSVPAGHGLTLVALAVFGAGAVGDLVWHEALGVEVGVEALLSPTHLLLLAGGLVLLTGPLREAWRSAGHPPSLRAFLPPLLSVTFAIAVIGFFLVYLSPFVNRTAGAGFERSPGQPHDHPATDPAELLQLLGVGSILMTTVLITAGMLLLLRRWPSPPRGSLTVMLGGVVALFVGLDEFSQPTLILCGLAAGSVGDATVRRLPPSGVGAAVALVLWSTYFALAAAFEGGVAWTAELWTGTTVLAALMAAGLGLVGAPTLRGDQAGTVIAR